MGFFKEVLLNEQIMTIGGVASGRVCLQLAKQSILTTHALLLNTCPFLRYIILLIKDTILLTKASKNFLTGALFSPSNALLPILQMHYCLYYRCIIADYSCIIDFSHKHNTELRNNAREPPDCTGALHFSAQCALWHCTRGGDNAWCAHGVHTVCYTSWLTVCKLLVVHT